MDFFWSLEEEEAANDDSIAAMLFDSSSDDDDYDDDLERGRCSNKKRDFIAANHRLVANYFNGHDSIYSEADFERRFRVPRNIFNRIHDQLKGTAPFVHCKDAIGKWGIYPLVKLVACFRFIAYGDAYDREDENLNIGETTMRMLVRRSINFVFSCAAACGGKKALWPLRISHDL